MNNGFQIEVSDVIQRLNSGESESEVCEDLHLTVEEVHNLLSQLGYLFIEGKWEPDKVKDGLHLVYLECKRGVDVITSSLRLQGNWVLVEALIYELNENQKSVSKLADELGVYDKRLRNVIKNNLGFTYNSSTKLWEKGENNMNIDMNQKILSSLQNLEKLLSSQSEVATTKELITNNDVLHSLLLRTLTLERNAKVRKTIVIDSTIGEKLDSYADKFKKVEKSEMLEIALEDFFEKYPLN